MSNPSFQKIKKFNLDKDGVWGKIGNGGGCDVHYLQTVITAEDLNKLKVISEIHESEKWPIQDLFQRNVNVDRVRSGIIPYLQNADEIKFFNPLTLLLLPVDSSRNVINEIPFLERKDDLLFDISAVRLTFGSHYSICLTNDSAGSFGQVQWNDNNCFLVAIDGQHRLFALKELLNENPSVLNEWKIPAQIVCIHKSNENTEAPRLIDAVRRIFVSINDKAQKLSTARKILLNDILPLDVATQSMIDLSHQKSDEPSNDILPLYLLDWRGDTTKDSSKLSILSIEEINAIINEYFDFSNEDQLKGGNHLVPYFLRSLGISKRGLDYRTNIALREKLKEDFIPALHFLLRRITKINAYISKIEKIRIDAKLNNKFDVTWAFNKEMYGQPSKQREDGFKFHSDWDADIKEYKSEMPELLRRDIGLRAILYVYSVIKQLELFKSTYTWLQFSDFLKTHLNGFISENWLLNPDEQKDKKIKSIMTNLVYDGAGKILNYRLNDVPKGLGALTLFVITSRLLMLNTFAVNEQLKKVQEESLNAIKDSYEKDLRKEVRMQISVGFTGTPDELKKEIKSKSEKIAIKKLSELENYIKNSNQGH